MVRRTTYWCTRAPRRPVAAARAPSSRLASPGPGGCYVRAPARRPKVEFAKVGRFWAHSRWRPRLGRACERDAFCARNRWIWLGGALGRINKFPRIAPGNSFRGRSDARALAVRSQTGCRPPQFRAPARTQNCQFKSAGWAHDLGPVLLRRFFSLQEVRSPDRPERSAWAKSADARVRAKAKKQNEINQSPRRAP